MAELTEADLDYLRNTNTMAGPNAGHSIDPTKPGPTPAPGPQDMREVLNEALRFLAKIEHEASAQYATLAARKICDVMEKLTALATDAQPGPQDVRTLLREARQYVADAGSDEELTTSELQLHKIGLLEDIDAALAQSDAQPWKCQAIHSSTGANDPAECDWPFCGCDPSADRVVEALRERGALVCCDDSDDAIAAALATPAIAQSDAQPVGWQTKPKDVPVWDWQNAWLTFAPTTNNYCESRPLWAREALEPVTFWYCNYRGEISRRVVSILGLRWGSSEYHKEPQWLLRGFDLEKEAEREFAVKDMAPTREALATPTYGLIEAAEWEHCDRCTGYGSNPPHGVILPEDPCSKCGGTGKVNRARAADRSGT